MAGLPETWALPDKIRQRLGSKAGKQRAMFAEGHLLLVLHRLHGPENAEREGVFFWRSPEGAWEYNRGGDGLGCLRNHVKQFIEATDTYESKYDHAGGVDDYYAILQAVSPLHRTARHLLETLQAARETVPEDRDLIDLRDHAIEVDRALDLLHADLRHALEHSLAKRGEEQAESTHRLALAGHRLNLFAMIFLPVTALASVFGMNLTSGLESQSPLGVFT